MTSEVDFTQLIDSEPVDSRGQALRDIFAGTMGGVAQVLSGQPFDTTKVRLQSSTDPNMTPMRVIRSLLRDEGPLAFYKGTLLPLVGIGACVSIQFSVNEYMKRTFDAQNGGGGVSAMSTGQFFLSGAAGGLSISGLAAPIEHVRIRLQVQTVESTFNGPMSVLRELYNTGGLRSIYRGLIPTLVREGVGSGMYFVTFESLVKNNVQKRGIQRKDVESWRLCLYGGLSGYTMWTVIYPVDIVKSKLQTDNHLNWKYKSIRHVMKDIYATRGLRGFFVGFGPTILRAAPANAATFVAFEQTMRLIS